MGGSNGNAECCHSPSDLATVSVSRCGDCAASPFLCGKEIFFTRYKFIGAGPVASLFVSPHGAERYSLLTVCLQ